MKYYFFTHSFNSREVGYSPQSTEPFEYKIGDMYNDEFIQHQGLISSIKLPEIQLMNKAIPTTLIGATYISFTDFLILKNYFIEFLKNFKIGEIQYWNLLVHHKKNILNDYSLFYMFNKNQDDFVNFTESKFLVGDGGNYFTLEGFKEVKINNYNEYIKMKEMLIDKGLVIISTKFILELQNLDLDMFRLNAHTGGYFVSERLKEAIEQYRFTGIRFQEIDDYDKKIVVRY